MEVLSKQLLLFTPNWNAGVFVFSYFKSDSLKNIITVNTSQTVHVHYGKVGALQMLPTRNLINFVIGFYIGVDNHC